MLHTLEGTDLENVESIKYLGVTITTYILAPQEVKETAYKGLVHPVLDYGSSVWDPEA